MKTINELSVYLDKFTQDTIKKVTEAQRETAQNICEEVIENAPIRSGRYISSIEIGETEVKNDSIMTSIFTELSANWPKHPSVPLAALLEWGTGPIGQGSNNCQHGYPYRQTQWTYFDTYLAHFVTTYGQTAKPHFLPALYSNRQTYIDNIRKALRS